MCPWNKYARLTSEDDFAIRHDLDDVTLLDLFSWSETEFNDRMAGSAIRRIGHERWLRNISIALGNALAKTEAGNASREPMRVALRARADHPSALVREHVAWALGQEL